MHIVVTGADGFIGKNLLVRLRESGHSNVLGLTRSTPADEARVAIAGADTVFHLAGVNRPQEPAEFAQGNADLTQRLATQLLDAGRECAVVYASSSQVALDNPYGRSKLAAEAALRAYAQQSGATVYLMRLTNVFGKWSRPDYNSAVATFCHNLARGKPISVNNPSTPLRLLYIDDLMETFLQCLVHAPMQGLHVSEPGPVYETTVGEVAATLSGFGLSRETLQADRVGTGLVRALYSTYLSFLPTEAFAYDVPRHADARGVFVEMLKTPDSGQFSYFTAHPGVTRGEHYHHSKTEKFLVIKGTAHYGFRHILSGQCHELVVSGGQGRIVETVPGWTHNITNIGSDELVVMLWANEIFNRAKPDTVAMKVSL
jgi:UDP-2-acetamido-2,6-beta-L-arabino-hexul-4-ose reductase